MKKLFLVGMMTMLAGSAWAEWVFYAETDTSTFYYLISNERQPIESSAGVAVHSRQHWRSNAFSALLNKAVSQVLVARIS
jgi:hypothetical protein